MIRLKQNNSFATPGVARQWLLIVLMVFAAPGLFAQKKNLLHLVPYAGYVDFNNAFAKKYSALGGVYAYLGMGLNHALEADAGFSRIHYGSYVVNVGGFDYDVPAFNYNQFDLTMAYSNYRLTNLKWRAGAHLILTNDEFTDKSYILFAGLMRYRPNEYNAAIDVYQSFYNNYQPELKVFQVTGTFGFNFGNFYTGGGFYAETKGFYIRLSDPIGFDEKQFPSVRQSLSYIHKKFTLEGFWWGGFQQFAVQNDGFVVYNLAEKHLGAFGGSLKLMFPPKLTLTLKAAHGRFKEVGAGPIVTSTSVVLVAGLTL